MNKKWIAKAMVCFGCLCLTGCIQKDKKEESDIVQIGEYKGITLKEQKITVSEKEIEAEKEAELMQYAKTREVTDRGIRNGDIAYIHYIAKTEDENRENVEEEDYELIVGDGEVSKGFEEQLIGGRVGEKLKFSICFEDNNASEWSGQEVQFYVDIKKVEETLLPEVTDEFVKKNYDFEQVQDFEDYITKKVYECKERMWQEKMKEKAMKIIISNTTFGGSFEEDCTARYEEVIEAYKKYAKAFDMTYEEVLQNFDTSEKILHEQAVYDEGCWQVCSYILEKEEIQPIDQEYEKLQQEYVEEGGYDTVQEFIKDNGEECLREGVYDEMGLDYIYNHVIFQ